MANEKFLDLSTLQDGLERYDNSLANVAKSGDYNDLLNLPSSSSGNVIYGSSSVNGNTARKLITIYSGPSTLEQYDVLIVKLANGNNVETPTIGIGQSTYNIKVGSDAPSSANPLICTSNSILRFMYVGGYLHYIDPPGCYSALCQTSASTQEKTVGLPDNCVVRNGTKISMHFTNGNSFANTVKLSTNGSKADIWASNSVTSDTNQLIFDADTTVDFVNWHGHWEVVSDPTLSDVAKTGDYNDLLNKPESGASDYSDLTGTPFVKEEYQAPVVDITLTDQDVYQTDVWRKNIQPGSDAAIELASAMYGAHPEELDTFTEIENFGIELKVNGHDILPQDISYLLEHHLPSGIPAHSYIFAINDDSNNIQICAINITYYPDTPSWINGTVYINEVSSLASETVESVDVILNGTSYKFFVNPETQIPQLGSDELISIEIDTKDSSSASAVNNDVILFRKFTDYCVNGGMGGKVGTKIIIGIDEYSPDSISVNDTGTWTIDSANLTVYMNTTTIPTGMGVAVLPQIDIYPTDPEGDLTAFNAISAGTIVQISIPAIAYAVISSENLNQSASYFQLEYSGDYTTLRLNRPDGKFARFINGPNNFSWGLFNADGTAVFSNAVDKQ